MKGIKFETERLLIRPFKRSEAEIVAYNSRQPSVADAMSDMVLTDKKAGREWIKMIRRNNRVLAVELKEEKKCIGIIGIVPQSKIQGEMEILFSIADEYQNRGYITEAARAMIDWYFGLNTHDYLCAIVKTTNPASQRVIDKLGFEFMEIREILYDGKPTMFRYYRLHQKKT